MGSGDLSSINAGYSSARTRRPIARAEGTVQLNRAPDPNRPRATDRQHHTERTSQPSPFDTSHLGVVHVTLQLNPSYRTSHLDQVLELGGSVWRATERGLVRRVGSVAQEAYEQATEPEDPASTRASRGVDEGARP